MAARSESVMAVLEATVARCGDRPALKAKRGGAWQAISYREYLKLVRLAARGFMKLGLAPGQGLAIIGANRPEWLIADIAAIYAGGFPAGIYTTCSAEQCQYITHHCEAPVAVVENGEQLAKFLAVRAELPHLKALVLMEGTSDAPGVVTWATLLELGAEVPEAELDQRIDAQQPDDVCTLIYTSGTTGPPKAVMITHRNLTWTAKAAIDALGIGDGHDGISYLPLSHVAEQITSVHGPMSKGVTIWFAESLEKLGDNLREVRPRYFLGVPRVWEKIQAKIQAAGAQNPPLKKKIAAWARGVGLRGGYAEQDHGSRPFLYGLAHKLVFSKVRERLGLDRCQLQVTSAAPISKSTLEFFLSLGIPIFEVYGMSECTGPGTISTPTRYRTAKAGFCLPGAEIKIAADGEICMRGKHVFKGYFKDPRSTADALDEEGWLHSGDIGTIDAEGFLQITDRKKDLLITAGGENIPPQILEGHLKGIPAIMQAVVVGDARPYLGALLTLDPEKVPAIAESIGSQARDVQAAAACDAFRAYLQGEIDKLNTRLARVQTIKRWTVVPCEFTIDGGELTPTMKIRRKVIREKYAAQIESLYS